MKPGSYIPCPFHPDGARPNLFMDEDLNGYCFACGWRGTIVEVMRARGYSGTDLLFKQDEFLKLQGWVERSVNGGGANVRPTDGWEEASATVRLDLPMARSRWAFLLDRGYTMETMARFQTRSYRGMIFGWPANGDRWVTRWIGADKKYLYDTGFSRSSIYSPDPNAIGFASAVIVEGLLDVMKLWQAGYRNAFATLGGPTASQILQIRGFDHVYEMFDNDEGGDAHRRVLEHAGIKAKRVLYDGNDPGDLTEDQIQSALREVHRA